MTTENISTNAGTFLPDSGLSNPQPSNSIDADDAATQKLLEEAFNQHLGKDSSSTRVDSTPEPAKTPEPIVKAEEPTAPAQVAPASTEAAPTTVTPPETQSAQQTYNIPDWAKDLDPSIQKLVAAEIAEKQDLRHRYNSDRGRVSSLSQKLLNTERQVAELRSRATPPPQDPNLAAAAKHDADKQLAEWNLLKEEADPRLAKAFEGRLAVETASWQDKIAALEKRLTATVDPLYQHAQTDALDRERQLLLERVPNFESVIQSPEYDYWLKNVAEPDIAQLARTSQDHRTAVRIMNMYAPDAPAIHEFLTGNKVTQQVSTPQPNAQVQSVTSATQASTARADQVAQSRQNKVAAAPVVANQVNPMVSSSSDPFHGTYAGSQIDLDDPAVVAAFEKAFTQYSKR